MDLRGKFKKGCQKPEKGNREKYKTEEKAAAEIEKEWDSIVFANKVRPLQSFHFKELIGSWTALACFQYSAAGA